MLEEKCHIIVACCEKTNGIGKDNNIPWRLSPDLKHFKEITTNSNKKNAVVMGRKTWESIPNKPLGNRINVIISSQTPEKEYPNTCFFKSIGEALNFLYCKNKVDKIFFIGGEQIYKYALSYCGTIHLTQIFNEFDCDRFFPELTPNFYISEASEIHQHNDIRYRYLTYKRYSSNSPYNSPEQNYLDLMRNVLDNGKLRFTRSGDTLSLFGERMEFDLSAGVPLLTTKRMAWKTCIKELLWFISADTNNKTLQENGVHIWDGNSSRDFLDGIGLKDREEGDLGPVYGWQWRHSGAKYKDCHTDYTNQGIDQLQEIVNLLKTDPNSRRMILTAWNPKDLGEMALPPCHLMCQFYVDDGKLDCQLYQRSGDIFLGVPFNIFSYSVLVLMLCYLTDLKPGRLVHILGDTHIYKDHIQQCKTQLERKMYPLPLLKIKGKVENINDFKLDNFELVGYKSHPKIIAKMNI